MTDLIFPAGMMNLQEEENGIRKVKEIENLTIVMVQSMTDITSTKGQGTTTVIEKVEKGTNVIDEVEAIEFDA
jgi:uncharacterized hydantoinase/oxoprolinase family protein